MRWCQPRIKAKDALRRRGGDWYSMNGRSPPMPPIQAPDRPTQKPRRTGPKGQCHRPPATKFCQSERQATVLPTFSAVPWGCEHSRRPPGLNSFSCRPRPAQPLSIHPTPPSPTTLFPLPTCAASRTGKWGDRDEFQPSPTSRGPRTTCSGTISTTGATPPIHPHVKFREFILQDGAASRRHVRANNASRRDMSRA
jgi:hypothetical protein